MVTKNIPYGTLWWGFNKVISKSHLAQSLHRGGQSVQVYWIWNGKSPQPSKIHPPCLLTCEIPLTMNKIVLHTEIRLSNASTGSQSHSQDMGCLRICISSNSPDEAGPLAQDSTLRISAGALWLTVRMLAFSLNEGRVELFRQWRDLILHFKGSLQIAVLI